LTWPFAVRIATSRPDGGKLLDARAPDAFGVRNRRPNAGGTL